jgi:hypothetical protein
MEEHQSYWDREKRNRRRRENEKVVDVDFDDMNCY